MRVYGYWRDPLWLAGCLLYGVNRWWIKPEVAPGFLTGQFNDVLLIPCALPVMLWTQRWLGLRNHDAMPTFGEITSHLVLWSALFEWVAPNWIGTTGDPLDVLAYAAGALGAWIWWRRPLRGGARLRYAWPGHWPRFGSVGVGTDGVAHGDVPRQFPALTRNS